MRTPATASRPKGAPTGGSAQRRQRNLRYSAATSEQQSKWAQAIQESGDPTARRNEMFNVYDGTPRFKEWSKARLEFLRGKAVAKTAAILHEEVS